jgi:hypothetical protein
MSHRCTILDSCTSRVLRTPELLDGIFSVTDKSCNATNASVCKQWHPIALDALWRHLGDVYPLFNILAPLMLDGKSYVGRNFPLNATIPH